jgi:hypothetical protein
MMTQTDSEREPDRPDLDPQRRIREGSRRGGARVREEFEGVITRKRYCELVGIHRTTLKRWERAGVVEPVMQSVIGIRTATYAPGEVEVGRLAAQLLEENRGALSLKDAFERARRQVGS